MSNILSLKNNKRMRCHRGERKHCIKKEGAWTVEKSGKMRTEHLRHTEKLDHNSKCSFGSLTKAKLHWSSGGFRQEMSKCR